MVKIARKRRGITAQLVVSNLGKSLAAVALMYFLVTSIQKFGDLIDDNPVESSSKKVSHKTPLAYGTKELNENTAKLVEQAIHNGFRHIVTAGHHRKHNETAVGEGWKQSGVERNELFLQTSFNPFSSSHQDFQKQVSDPENLPETIEEQVKLSIQTSLRNLQTKYIDAVLFNNFRAKLWDTDEIGKAWKVLEGFVDQGIIRQLGITSVHNKEWFETFYNNTRIKPTIIQNRFHTNRNYDVPMQETFAKHKIWVQRFWLLNGSSGGGKKNSDTAKQKGVTPAQLMLAFVMSMGSETCLVGTKSLQHMKEDIEIARCYPSLFIDEQERQDYAKKLGMKQPPDLPLPGKNGINYGIPNVPKCQAAVRSF